MKKPEEEKNSPKVLNILEIPGTRGQDDCRRPGIRLNSEALEFILNNLFNEYSKYKFFSKLYCNLR